MKKRVGKHFILILSILLVWFISAGPAEAVTCIQCGRQFSTNSPLSTGLKCPKCRKGASKPPPGKNKKRPAPPKKKPVKPPPRKPVKPPPNKPKAPETKDQGVVWRCGSCGYSSRERYVKGGPCPRCGTPSSQATPAGTDPEAILEELVNSLSEEILKEHPQPVSPGKAAAGAAGAAAVGLASAFMALLQSGMSRREALEALGLLPRTTGAPPAPVPAGVPQLGEEREGKVWCRPPWDQGGPSWISKADYQFMREQQRKGLAWNDRWGWTANEDAAGREQALERNREMARDRSERLNRDIQREQRQRKEVQAFVTQTEGLVNRFEADPDRQQWYRDFIKRHAKRDAQGDYQIDQDSAARLYDAIRKQTYEKQQLDREAERAFLEGQEKELGERQAYVESVRDNAARANRLLAKFDPTGTGSRILKIQGMVCAGINGYEEGGLSGAAGAMGASQLDGYTQGFASKNYRVVLDYYGKGKSYKDADGRELSFMEALAKANRDHADSQWNPATHAKNMYEGLRDGDMGKVFDATMDLGDAKKDLTDFAGKVRGGVARGMEAAEGLRTGQTPGDLHLRVASGTDAPTLVRGGETAAGTIPFRRKAELPSDVDPDVAATRRRVEDALHPDKTPEQRQEAIREMYQEEGMRRLGELERQGGLATDEAKALNEFITRDVNDSVTSGTKSALERLARNTGVKINKVMVGDSGSSANPLSGRSIVTDADRTVVLDIDSDSLKTYAMQQQMTPEQARAHLEETFIREQTEAVNAELAGRGLTAEDVDQKIYNGIGADAGPDDAYPEGYVTTRMAVEGKAQIFRLDSNGDAKEPITTSGQSMVDEVVMRKSAETADRQEANDILWRGGKTGKTDADGMLTQQVHVIEGDPAHAEKVAKALDRVDKAARVKQVEPPDPELTKLARKIRSQPQKAMRNMSPEEQKAFIRKAQNAIRNINARWPQ